MITQQRVVSYRRGCSYASERASDVVAHARTVAGSVAPDVLCYRPC